MKKGVLALDEVCEACGGTEFMPHSIGSPVCCGRLEARMPATADEIVLLRAALRESIRYAGHIGPCLWTETGRCACGFLKWRNARDNAMTE